MSGGGRASIWTELPVRRDGAAGHVLPRVAGDAMAVGTGAIASSGNFRSDNNPTGGVVAAADAGGVARSLVTISAASLSIFGNTAKSSQYDAFAQHNFTIGGANHVLIQGTQVRFVNPLLSLGGHGVYVSAALGADRTVSASTDPHFLAFDPNGADRKVVLPTEAIGVAGGIPWFIFHSGGANVLNVRDSADAATIVTLNPGQLAILISDGTNYKAWGPLGPT